MPDIYANVTETDPALLERIADVLEIRAAEPQQQAMLASYLAEVPFPSSARVLEIGCGTGAVSRQIAARPDVAEVIGADPSSVLLGRARHLGEGIPNLHFEEADGRALPFPNASFDVAVGHTVLCHVPGPEGVLHEAFRVLRPGGWLAIFDGDYVTVSVAIADNDPLQTCAAAAVANLVHDPWLARRLPALAEAAGFAVTSFRSHAYTQTHEPTYLLSLIDRGIDFQVAQGLIGPELGEALRVDARRRADDGRFYGQIAYTSLVAQRPVSA